MLKVTFTGYIGADCRTRLVGDQVAITFSVAATKQFKNRQGVEITNTTWIGCTIWKNKDNMGTITEYLKTGRQVLIEGEPSIRPYFNPAEPTVPLASFDCRVAHLELLGRSAPATIPEPDISKLDGPNKEEDLPF